jgi:3-deoxy-D-manno-octulosonic acid kinase
MFDRQSIDRGAILFDPERVAAPGTGLFEPELLRARGTLSEERGGRGSILFFDEDGVHWVLRRYLRGGMAARVARDRYLWLGEERTRSFRELRLLGELRRRKLPVPVPVAARYLRGLVSYRAELITERLPGARPLSALLAERRMDDARWTAVGRCLRSFHDAGVQHADLNANNIMLGEQGETWLLDFDRGRLREPGAWREGVLDRLARSLAKIGAGATDWQAGFELLRLAHDA